MSLVKHLSLSFFQIQTSLLFFQYFFFYSFYSVIFYFIFLSCHSFTFNYFYFISISDYSCTCIFLFATICVLDPVSPKISIYIFFFLGANPTLRDTGRGLRAEQWARYCGRYVCADVIEKFARHRLLERSTSCGRWGSESDIGTRLLLGKVVPVPTQVPSPPQG